MPTKGDLGVSVRDGDGAMVSGLSSNTNDAPDATGFISADLRSASVGRYSFSMSG